MKAGGEVPGVALVTASRPHKKAAWTYSSLKLEVDKVDLDELRRRKEEQVRSRRHA